MLDSLKFKDRYSHEIPKWARLLGVKRTDRDTIYFVWGYLSLYRNLCLTIEFPSELYEEQLVKIRLGVCLFTLMLFVPWYKKYKDYYQCSGPLFGFDVFNSTTHPNQIFNPQLTIYYGNDTGSSKEKKYKCFNFLTDWKFSNCISEEIPGTFPYVYDTKNGERQCRLVTIKTDERTWVRYWIPHKITIKSLDVTFDDEIGENCGSWKGGVISTGINMLPNEEPIDALRRMERTTKL